MNVYRRFSIPKMGLNLLVIFEHIFCDVGFRSHHPYVQTKLDSRRPHESQMHLRTVWLISHMKMKNGHMSKRNM